MDDHLEIEWIDLFCGAGGTTTGIHLANARASVIACVNHDQKAIESHKANHPDCLHISEDIRDFKVIKRLKILVDKRRKLNPNVIIALWASLECTNYSKAKGGLPRDADSRTLAEHLNYYLEALEVEYLYIENVREFMAWGPLDNNGKPISRKNGTDYIRWVNSIKDLGYKFDFKLLNAADFGAYTSRTRYFGIFAKKGYPISWPEPTHAKSISKDEGMFKNHKKKWKAVKDVLKLEVQGESIFTRKKPLSENTLKRIYAGLIKFVAGGKENFTKVYNSGNDMQRVKSIDEPIGSLTTQNSHAVVKADFLYHNHGGQPSSKVWGLDVPNRTVTGSGNHYKVNPVFIKKYYSGRPEGKVISIEGPAGTVTSFGSQALVHPVFLTSYYGNSMGAQSAEKPCPTLTTKDRINAVQPQFFMSQYSGGGEKSDINDPCPTITGNPKQNLVTTKWLLDHQYNNLGRSIDEAAPTIIARQDKKPLYLVEVEDQKDFVVAVFEDDNETMILIKEFMAIYGIVDIKMRMLLIDELKAIQGFPKDYILKGTKGEQKKFIGNSVETTVAKMIVEAHARGLETHMKLAI